MVDFKAAVQLEEISKTCCVRQLNDPLYVQVDGFLL